jgi:hypothetical protein
MCFTFEPKQDYFLIGVLLLMVRHKNCSHSVSMYEAINRFYGSLGFSRQSCFKPDVDFEFITPENSQIIFPVSAPNVIYRDDVP